MACVPSASTPPSQRGRAPFSSLPAGSPSRLRPLVTRCGSRLRAQCETSSLGRGLRRIIVPRLPSSACSAEPAGRAARARRLRCRDCSIVGGAGCASPRRAASGHRPPRRGNRSVPGVSLAVYRSRTGGRTSGLDEPAGPEAGATGLLAPSRERKPRPANLAEPVGYVGVLF